MLNALQLLPTPSPLDDRVLFRRNADQAKRLSVAEREGAQSIAQSGGILSVDQRGDDPATTLDRFTSQLRCRVPIDQRETQGVFTDCNPGSAVGFGGKQGLAAFEMTEDRG